MGTAIATAMPSHWLEKSVCPANIQAMPPPATPIAPQVCNCRRWPVTTRDNNAVRSGPTASVTSTLATVVNVKASMKAVNITLQHTPDNHSADHAWRMRANTARPCHVGNKTSKDTPVKKLRQKVTSKLRADASCRVTTPAVDHISATRTMRSTTLECVNFTQQGHLM